ncbi:MAG: sulfur carrier protein ThiS [Bacteroidales bacterium]|nr:sulfur carrier protein ThiS [Bacteroidales bacterium]MDD4821836.1 sulfur carrier protein ThiS [Bacteroidales bacterium]
MNTPKRNPFADAEHSLPDSPLVPFSGESTIIISLNGKDHEVKKGTSLSDFIRTLGLQPKGIAIAIDYEVVPKDKWQETILSDRLELMLIHAVSGG